MAALAPPATPAGSDQAIWAHQPGYAVAAHIVACPAELTSDPRCPIGPAGVPVDLADLIQQLDIRGRPS